jgi:Flp pilus assembly pilin Flp
LCPHVLAISLRIQRRHYKQNMRKTISLLIGLIRNTEGQDVAEYAIMLAVVLVIVVGIIRMIGSNAGIVFSQVASGIQ